MTPSLPGFAGRLVYAWTCAYTWRLPAAVRDDRRREIASDLWESHDDRDRRDGLPHAIQVLGRMFAGMPDDVLWRWEHRSSRRSRAAMTMILASTVVLIVAALWVVGIAQFEPPDPPAMIKVVAYPAPPPPPPPPPPPLRQPDRGRD